VFCAPANTFAFTSVLACFIDVASQETARQSRHVPITRQIRGREVHNYRFFALQVERTLTLLLTAVDQRYLCVHLRSRRDSTRFSSIKTRRAFPTWSPRATKDINLPTTGTPPHSHDTTNFNSHRLLIHFFARRVALGANLSRLCCRDRKHFFPANSLQPTSR
jgi:hypothetical protein